MRRHAIDRSNHIELGLFEGHLLYDQAFISGKRVSHHLHRYINLSNLEIDKQALTFCMSSRDK